jgi:hypothetical protein
VATLISAQIDALMVFCDRLLDHEQADVRSPDPARSHKFDGRLTDKGCAHPPDCLGGGPSPPAPLTARKPPPFGCPVASGFWHPYARGSQKRAHHAVSAPRGNVAYGVTSPYGVRGFDDFTLSEKSTD